MIASRDERWRAYGDNDESAELHSAQAWSPLGFTAPFMRVRIWRNPGCSFLTAKGEPPETWVVDGEANRGEVPGDWG